MDKDIVPELLKSIQKDFDKGKEDSETVQQLLKILDDGQANYLNANAYAVEIGELLSKVLDKNITAEVLPDGKMYFNIADRILNTTLRKNYELITDYSTGVQSQLNKKANLSIKPKRPSINQDRIDGIVNRISSEDSFDDIKWILGDPIVNFSQSIIDDAIKINAELHYEVGLNPEIKRIAVGKACKWCRSLAGRYSYPDNVPKDVYHRHENCRCMVDYHPKDGRGIQDVWSKKWSISGKFNNKNLKKQEENNEHIKKAKRLIRIAKDAERNVTKDLIEISDKLGTEMVGLEYRIKSEESLSRKISNEPEAKMRDVLRYTNIANPEEQVEKYLDMIDELKERGYNVSEVKNYWLNEDNPYNGININLLTPSQYEFELQFHTKESFELKNGKLHELYEKRRVLDPIKDIDAIIELDNQMYELSNKLTKPINIEKIRSEK